MIYGLYSSPRAWWGDSPPSEAYLLDLLESDLKRWRRGAFDQTIEQDTTRLARVMHPALWSRYIEASREDLRAWKMLQAVLRKLRTADLLASVETLDHEWERDALSQLIGWAVDVASGALKEPPAPQGRPREDISDALIAGTVKDIRCFSKSCYESKDDEEIDGLPPDEPKSACGVIAKRLGMKYETVRKAWHRSKGREKKLG